MSDFDYDLFVIGAGSGGVRAARISASHGAKVAVAEEYRVGGTCVIRGCVPKKLLVYGSHFSEDLEDARNYGWTLGKQNFSWPVLRDHVLNDVDRLNTAYTTTLESNGVESYLERATVKGPHDIAMASGKAITAKYILIAVGGWPDMPDIEGMEHAISSNETFHLEQLPKRLLVYGGGYIANEFAGIFNGLGSEVTLVNRSERLLRGYDEQIVERMTQISIAKGINIQLNCELDRIEKQADGTLHAFDTEGKAPMVADKILIATGRKPNSANLGLEEAGVALDAKGAVKVNEFSQTSCDSIYAVGDVTDRVQLTPVAIREGHAFADSVFGGKQRSVDYGCIPSAVFCQPPIGAVGQTESEVRATYGSANVYSSDFRSMKNIFSNRAERSLYKMVCHPDDDTVLGLHMISPDAPEILQGAAVAIKAGLNKQAFDDTVAIHPSMAEELVLLK